MKTPTASGKDLVLETIKPSNIIKQVKKEIFAREGIPISKQSLYMRDKRIFDHEQLSKYCETGDVMELRVEKDIEVEEEKALDDGGSSISSGDDDETPDLNAKEGDEDIVKDLIAQ